MANMDLSLDDIIQKKFSKNANKRGKGNVQRGQVKRLDTGGRVQNLNRNHVNRRGGPPRRQGGTPSGIVGDARLKIIQKNRLKLTDARDKLAEIAKQSDARLKLEKLRGNRKNAASNISRVGTSITRRTGRNGQISLTTNKRGPAHNLNNTQQRTIIAGRAFNIIDSDMDVDIDIEPVKATVLRRTVSNDRSGLLPPQMFAPPVERRSMYNTWVKPVSSDSPPPLEDYETVTRSTIRGPILREPILKSPVSRRSPVQPTSLKIIARNSPQPKRTQKLLSEREEWNYESQTVSHSSATPIARVELDDSEEEEGTSWRRSGSVGNVMLGGRMSSELKARLDTPVVPPRTMGILSSATAKSSSPATSTSPTGHRIVVSNLQPSVTHEDIRELFEDIGPLVTSRLVRPGTAEVVYQLHKDAVKAVDAYHNRQLDGQPMKCMLVNSRPLSIPSASRNSTSSRGSTSSSFKLPTGGKSSVVPDIGTIHKALFNKA